MKKILAMILAALLVLAMGVGAMADDEPAATTGVWDSTATTLTIPKGLLLINAVDGNYYSPNVTFTYTIAPVAPAENAVVTDKANNTAVVRQGVEGGATLANSEIKFDSESKSFTAAGNEITKELTVAVDLSKFTQPGVYRYKISDTTTDPVLFAAGIVRPADYETDRYLDVYIEYNEAGTELQIAGYVLAKDNTSKTTASTDKTSGFDVASETKAKEDKYTTYNVTLKKMVSGSLGDKTHEFPFEITVSNNSLTYFYKETEGEGAATVANAAPMTNTALSGITLKDKDMLYLFGLSPKATVAYTERNDTADTYQVQVSTETAATNVSSNGTHAFAAAAITDYDTVNSNEAANTQETLSDDNKAITFTNTLNAISPTGVVLRFAPYIIMAGIAVVLLVLAARRRKDTQDKSSSI